MGNMVCHVCGKGYDPADVEMYATTKDVQLSILDMDNPGMRKLLGMETLMRSPNCGKVCCADCAKEGAGPTGLVCPACSVPFAANSFIRPTAQAVNAAPPAAPQAVNVNPPSAAQPATKAVEQKPEKSGGLFGWLRKKR